MPDGEHLTRTAFDRFMMECGKFAETTLETIMGAKAQYNARRWDAVSLGHRLAGSLASLFRFRHSQQHFRESLEKKSAAVALLTWGSIFCFNWFFFFGTYMSDCLTHSVSRAFWQIHFLLALDLLLLVLPCITWATRGNQHVMTYLRGALLMWDLFLFDTVCFLFGSFQNHVHFTCVNS